jgi:hypothetical protein
MATAASPTSTEIKHHVTLTDGTTTLGFIAGRINDKGFFNPDVRSINRFPLERHALKTYQGQSKYDDSQWPYITIAQDDWSGGRGSETFDDDVSRFFDSYRVDTTREGRIILGGQETFAYGYRDIDENKPSDMGWVNLLSDRIYYATKFTSQALDDTNYAADKAQLWVKKTGSPTGNVIVDLCSDNSGNPGTTLKTASAAISTDLTDTVSELLEFDWSGTYTLTDNTVYWIKIYHTGGDSDNYISVAVGGVSSNEKMSSDNSSWVAGVGRLYYRVTDADTFPSGFLFEYKRSLYFVSQPDSGNSFLYLNGDRGTADSNSGDKTNLEDASKSATWVADEWIGCCVVIIAGPGSEEKQPWRKITDNDTTSLQVSPDWNVTHTTATDYVILGSNKWTSMLDLGDYVTDVAVAGDYCYFARGEDAVVLRYQVYNDGNSWETRNDAETHEATYILALDNPTLGTYLYLGQNANDYLGTAVRYGKVPRHWGDLYNSLGVLCETDTPWDEAAYANATQGTEWGMTKISLTDTFTTGIAASEVVASTDITEGKKIGFIIRSTIALDANDLQIQMSDLAELGGTSLDLNIPAIAANTWTWVETAMSPLGIGKTANSGHDEIISVGLNVAVDKNANYDLHLAGGIHILSDILATKDISSEAKITNMVRYAGNASDPRLNPWVITENAIYEVQTQNDNVVVPLPIGEIENMRSEVNAQAIGVNDVYMWFNLKDKVERYYARNLDDVGPDRDAGLPNDRKGIPSAIVSHPGRVYLALDGGADEYSSVLVYRSNGWHEVYRAPRVGERILSMHIQTIPHKSIDYLWINMGSDLLWLPISYNPYLDEDYKFTHEGNLTTGWFYAANHNLIKIFNTIQAYTESATANSYFVQADYKIDADTSWTPITGSFVDPFTEIDISSASPPNVTGRRIRFRLRFYTTDEEITPLLKAFVLKAYGVDDVKYGIAMPCILSEDNLKVDLAGDEESGWGQYDRVEDAVNKVQAWIDAGTPLTQNSPISIYNDKTVIIDPVASQPTYLHAEDQHEEHLAHLVINEI